MKPYDLIVFDWDGTLMDSTATIARCIQLSCADVGLPVPSMQAASHVIGLGLRDALAHFAPSADETQVQQLVQRYRVHYLTNDANLVLFEGVEPFLERLSSAGYQMAIATGKNRVGLDRALSNTTIAHHFGASRTADETESKPHPQMLHELMEHFSVPPQRVLMVGDTTHDLEMAVRAGTHAAAVSTGAHPQEQLLGYPVVACVPTVVHLAEHLAA
jgi:phosphoglycolate phosphatase